MNDDARALKCPGVLFESAMQILHCTLGLIWGLNVYFGFGMSTQEARDIIF